MDKKMKGKHVYITDGKYVPHCMGRYGVIELVGYTQYKVRLKSGAMAVVPKNKVKYVENTDRA